MESAYAFPISYAIFTKGFKYEVYRYNRVDYCKNVTKTNKVDLQTGRKLDISTSNAYCDPLNSQFLKAFFNTTEKASGLTVLHYFCNIKN